MLQPSVKQERPLLRLLAAVLCVLVLLCGIAFFCDISFETNDDSLIEAIAAGWLTGEPNPATVSTSYLYGLLLSSLYRVLPSIAWHGLILMTLNALSLVAILYSLLTLARQCRLSPLWGGLSFLGLWLGVELLFTAQLQFTATSGLCCSAALLLFFCRGASRKAALTSVVCALVLLLMAALLRPKVALMLLPFGLLFAMAGLLRKGAPRKQLIGLTLLSIAIVGGVFASDALLYGAQPDWAAYQAFDAQNTALLDYNAHALTDEQQIQAAQAADWSTELFGLVRNWYFLDDRINTESLTRLNETLSTFAAAQSKTPLSILYAAASILRRYPMFGWNFVGYGLVALLAAIVLLRRHQPVIALLTAALMGYGVVLIAYFYGVLGRFPLRLAFAVACMLFAALLPCLAKAAQAAREKRKGLAACGLCVLLLCNGASFALQGRSSLTLRSAPSVSRSNAAVTDEIAAYAMAHKDTVFVTNRSIDVLPTTVYPVGCFTNVIIWSNGISGSPTAMAQLNALGYEAFAAQNLFDGNVRLLLVGGSSVIDPFFSYLQNDYGATAYILEEQVGSLGIYRVLK